MSASGGALTRNYSISFTEPYFLGYRLAAGFDLFLGMAGSGSGRHTVTISGDGLRIELTGDESISMDALSTSTKVSGLAASALTLWWAARATGLAAAMAASIPAWSSFDPLPIVERSPERRDRKRPGRRGDAGTPTQPTLERTPTVQAAPRTLLITDDLR